MCEIVLLSTVDVFVETFHCLFLAFSFTDACGHAAFFVVLDAERNVMGTCAQKVSIADNIIEPTFIYRPMLCMYYLF